MSRLYSLHAHQPAESSSWWTCRGCLSAGIRTSRFATETELREHEEGCEFAAIFAADEDENELDEYGDLLDRAKMEDDDAEY
jgi:hypothetical protein